MDASQSEPIANSSTEGRCSVDPFGVDRVAPEAESAAEAEPSPRAAPLRDSHRPSGLQARLEGALLRWALKAVGDPPVAVRLWNGAEYQPAAGAPIGRLLVRGRRTLWRLIVDPLYQFGEAYGAGQLEVEGDLVEVLIALERHLNRTPARRRAGKQGSAWFGLLRRNTLQASRRQIHRHYDIGNDFYRLWLDAELVYTCAYFAEADYSLEQAQLAKMDHVCRKLQLQPGQTVVEAGCGWGALALYMAREYGVTVRAYNISHEQIRLARERARRENLAGRVEFIEDDWRNITGRYDAFVSVGMLEHIGPENYRRLGDVIDACLTPQGRGLIHSIGRNRPFPLDTWTQRRIFPGAHVPALREMMDVFEPHDFSILDVENLRLHYAETLRHWLARYEQSLPAVREMFDDEFARIWRLYLAGSIAAFEVGGMQLFQVVFARGDCNNVPRTRAHLYEAVVDSG